MDRPIENLLIDLDGTLTNPLEGVGRSLNYAMSQMKIDVDPGETFSWVIGPPIQASIARLMPDHSAREREEALQHYRKYYGERGAYENELYEGIRDTLKTLRLARFRMYLCTSKALPFARQVIQHFRLEEYFDAIHGSELDGRRKDKAELIEYVLSSHDLSPEHTLMVGDTRYDLIGAKKNNIRSAGVTWGFGEEKDLTEHSPDFLFHSPVEWSDKLLILR